MPEGADQSFSGVGFREDAAAHGVGPSPLEDRIADLENPEPSPFLRGQKRVPVRSGAFQKRTASRLRRILGWVAVCTLAGAASTAVYRYGRDAARFRVDSSDSIEIGGTHNVSRDQVLAVMGADIGRNVFFIPLEERKRTLEKIPWVESATVMRLLPNRLRISIRERTPVAFAKIGDRIELIDTAGVQMEMPAGSNFSFPVIAGIGPSEPLSVRSARMKTYFRLLQQLDSTGANYSRDLDEVDLSDPEDVRVSVADRDGALLIHLGSGNFLERFTIYKTHLQEWRAQFPRLKSVDLRYERQVILNPDARGAPAAEESASAEASSSTPADKRMSGGDSGSSTPANKNEVGDPKARAAVQGRGKGRH